MAQGYINIPEYGAANWRESVDSAVDLPTNGNQPGDARIALDTDTIYIWSGTEWVAAGGGGGGSGTVTDVSVVTANGFAGTVLDPTTIPAITIETTVTGILYGNGTAVATAVPANFPTLNQSTTGTAANITATSNSTLTSLPNLSLPASQLTGKGNLTDGTSDGITITGGTGAVIGSGTNISQQVATTSTNGYLASIDWNTFNGKQNALTLGDLTIPTNPNLSISGGTGAVIGSGTALSLTGASLSETVSSVLTLTGATNAVLGSGVSIQVKQAGTSQAGYLSSTDWNTFNNKQSTLTFSDSLVNTSGTVTLVNDSSNPGFTQYYGTNAAGTLGYYSIPSGTTGANTALSNLAAVAINLSLLPGTNNSINLGSAADTWANVYVGTEIFTPLVAALAAGGALSLDGGVAASNSNGGGVNVLGAVGSGVGTGGNGGTVAVTGGNANGNNTANQSGGAVNLTAGNSFGSATGGTVTISSGNGGIGTSTAGATGGTTNINGGTGGAGSSTSGNGGGATLKAGSGGGGVGGGAGGTASVTGGTGGTGSASGGNGGAVNITGGSPASFASSNGGAVTVAGGNGSGTGAGGAGGSVTISSGTAGGDNTQNNNGGSVTITANHSMGSANGPAVTITAGTGGVGTSSTGANGGNTAINAGNGGVGSSTGGNGGNVVISAGAGGNSGTPGSAGIIQFETGATTSITERFRVSNAACYTSNSQLQVNTAGFGLGIAHGTNCKLGTAVLSGGTVTVANTAVTSTSLIFLTTQSAGGTVGYAYVSAKTNGTSFVITSTSGTDSSTVAFLIIEAL